MEKSIYIASSLDNFLRVQHLRNKFAELGIRLTYDWTTHNGGQLRATDPDAKRAIAECELRGVVEADAVLVVMPGLLGTHFEFGAAFALRKPIVLLLDQHTGTSPSFHHLDGVVRCHSESDAIVTVLSFLSGERQVAHDYINSVLGAL